MNSHKMKKYKKHNQNIKLVENFIQVYYTADLFWIFDICVLLLLGR